ncbi:hypothetical protein SNOG_07908 [Paecilomyces variotii No. 5]|uniref:Uncharacterized protein n=1 Tax=Byssochlamys spectabilis (strain No. 5 / NBRC 109023) TaxID=1356009 RepID=V5G1X2_BYSSN|nr:hypothetical protein SNOG_07908 [Paecilomyces variotii No. 5]
MVKIEIERKFIYKPSLFAYFICGLGNPPFASLKIKGKRKIHDIYYDAPVASTIDGNANARGSTPGILERNGIWVRRRNERWEAKQRLILPQQKQQEEATGSSIGSSQSTKAPEKERDYYLRTAFKELTCPLAIHNLVKSYIPSAPGADGDFGLRPIADFSTKRVLAVADGQFEIALDHASFGHFVGEVELLVDKGKEAQAQREIDDFMEIYRWFFFPGDAGSEKTKGRKKEYMLQGKLSAYFEKYPVKF